MTVHKSGVKLEDLKEGDWLPEEDANRLLNDPDMLGRTFMAMQESLAKHFTERAKQRASEETKP